MGVNVELFGHLLDYLWSVFVVHDSFGLHLQDYGLFGLVDKLGLEKIRANLNLRVKIQIIFVLSFLEYRF